MDRESIFPQAVSVAAFRIDMQLGGHLGVLEGHEVDHRIFDVCRIVFRLHDEGRWGLRQWGWMSGLGAKFLSARAR